jgi:hypothetical protein
MPEVSRRTLCKRLIGPGEQVLVPKPGLYQWESPNALIDVAIPTSLLLEAGKGCLPLFVSLCPLPPRLSSKCNTLITPEDTPPGMFRQAGWLNEDSHAYGITSWPFSRDIEALRRERAHSNPL